MRKIYEHKNYILQDPFIDFMNMYHERFGYKKDSDYVNFDSDLLLDNYVKENKKKFISLIREKIGTDYKEYENSIGKADLMIRTNVLCKHFKNGSMYTGENFSLITIEYCNLNISKKGYICDYPLQQKYYKYKNWMLKKECEKNNIKIDYCFIVARRYGSIESYNTLFVNDSEYSSLEQEIRHHFYLLDSNKYVLGKNIFPNMKNKSDFPWHNAKKKISQRLHEITCIKGLNFKKRNEYVEKGVFKYTQLDIDCVVNKIPLHNNGQYIPRYNNSLYVDFEILTNIYDDFTSFPKANKDIVLFNIGCGYEKRQNFAFKSYVAHELSQEKRILNEFISFINSLKGEECTIFHWTHIEKTILTKKIKQYSLNVNKEIHWYDLYKFFNDNEILVKGCYTYKLKHVARALYKTKLIKSKWDSTFSDGLGAMTGYIKYLHTKDKKLMNDIAHYNMIDCKVLWEIKNLFS